MHRLRWLLISKYWGPTHRITTIPPNFHKNRAGVGNVFLPFTRNGATGKQRTLALFPHQNSDSSARLFPCRNNYTPLSLRKANPSLSKSRLRGWGEKLPNFLHLPPDTTNHVSPSWIPCWIHESYPTFEILVFHPSPSPSISKRVLSFSFSLSLIWM